MLKALEAVIDEQGNVRFAEPVNLPPGRRAVVIVFDEPPADLSDTALLSETALAEDWNRPEEDDAWSHLQQLALS